MGSVASGGAIPTIAHHPTGNHYTSLRGGGGGGGGSRWLDEGNVRVRESWNASRCLEVGGKGGGNVHSTADGEEGQGGMLGGTGCDPPLFVKL